MLLAAGGVSIDGVTPIGSTGLLRVPQVGFSLLGGPFDDPYSGGLILGGGNWALSQPISFQLSVSNSTGISSHAIPSNMTRRDGTFSITASDITPLPH